MTEVEEMLATELFGKFSLEVSLNTNACGALTKIVSFQGRSSREEFWLFQGIVSFPIMLSVTSLNSTFSVNEITGSWWSFECLWWHTFAFFPSLLNFLLGSEIMTSKSVLTVQQQAFFQAYCWLGLVVVAIPAAAMCVRRLHDSAISGWLLLAAPVLTLLVSAAVQALSGDQSVFAAIWYFGMGAIPLWLFCEPTDERSNAYGPGPWRSPIDPEVGPSKMSIAWAERVCQVGVIGITAGVLVQFTSLLWLMVGFLGTSDLMVLLLFGMIVAPLSVLLTERVVLLLGVRVGCSSRDWWTDLFVKTVSIYAGTLVAIAMFMLLYGRAVVSASIPFASPLVILVGIGAVSIAALASALNLPTACHMRRE